MGQERGGRAVGRREERKDWEREREGGRSRPRAEGRKSPPL